MSIKANIEEFRNVLKGTDCRLIAVSKTKPPQMILEAFESGQIDFGENKVQELREKPALLPEGVQWHMIGHLQTNKVKYIAPFIYMIHAADSLKLLKEIDKQARKNERTISCLLQIHIAQEAHKFGFTEEELIALLDTDELDSLTHIKISGLMGMATYTEDQSQIRNEFRSLKSLFDTVRLKYQKPNLEFVELSMGMSGDYKIAIEEGSTMIRIGSKIFGPRAYVNR